MSSGQSIFSIDLEKPGDPAASLSYQGLIRVLKPEASLQGLVDGYHVLDGMVPADGAQPTMPLRLACSAGGVCAMCSGSPDCNGGPPPLQRELDKARSQLIQSWAPGASKILVSHSLRREPQKDGTSCLVGPQDDSRLRIPIFDPPADQGELRLALCKYRRAARIDQQVIAFHVYQIVGTPDDPSWIAGLCGKLIAIPVACSSDRLVAAMAEPDRRKSRRAV